MKKVVFKRKDKCCFGNRSGFTLVEAITTLVILAIVAAVAIPSLVGYIDSSREKVAVEECHTVVEAANALGVEHVLEAGVVNYDAVVPLANTSETGESVYSSVTKEAILKRAELEDRGEIKNFSFNPEDSGGYSQPAYLVNEEEVVVSAAADITLAKNIVSPLAVSVEKTDDSTFVEATGISLTYLEYTASNGIDVVYHNGGYQASSKVNVDFKNHNLTATVKQVLTCEQDEIVLFRCSGCDICDGTNNYSVTAVTAFAPGHNYGALTCIGKDKHEQTCTNVLNRLAEGDKALSVGDTFDLEPQYNDFNNLPRVGVECTDKIDGEHFGDITEEVELTKDLERDIPFSLDGVYNTNGTVTAGKYTVMTCSGCGYSEYETQTSDGLVIIDNNDDNVADSAKLCWDTVAEATEYLNDNNSSTSQIIKLLGDVKESQPVEVKGKHTNNITIKGLNRNIEWVIKSISFASETNEDNKLILRDITISGNNNNQEIIQVSRAVTILEAGCTVKDVTSKSGAIRLTGGTLEIYSGAVIENCINNSNNGGAISASSKGGIINLYGGIIENCSCAKNGGAIYVNSSTTLNIKGDPVVVNNTATQKGNNIYLESGKTLNVIGNISGTKTIGIESADDLRNQVSGEFGTNENTDYSNGKTIAAFKNDVNEKLHAEVKDGKVIWAEEKVSGNGTGNWRDPKSDKIEYSEEGVEFYVTGADGGCWNYDLGQNLGPYEAELYLTNRSDSIRHVKRFELTFRVEYNHAWMHEYDDFISLSVGGSSLSNAMYTYTVNGDTITVRNSEYFTQTALDYIHRNENTLAPGANYKFQINFGKDPSGKLIDLEDEGTNFYLEDCNVEFIETFATEVELKCKGDASAIKRIGYYTYEVSSCDQNGNILINDGNIYPDGSNPIVFYLLAGNTAGDSSATIKLYGNDPNLSLYEFQIPRRELIANADNEGKIVIEVPAFDFGLRIKHSNFDTYNYAKKIRINGAGISKTVDIDGFNLDTYVTGLIPNKNSRDNITVSILSENDLVIANGEIVQETWKNYSAGNNYEVNVNPTAVVLNLKTAITDNSISSEIAEIDIKGAEVYLDSKTVDINGGNTEILAVPTNDNITVNLKVDGKTIAQKEVYAPELGTAENVEITNDDLYSGPEIPEPEPNKINIAIEYDCELKEDVKTIEISQYGNSISKFMVGVDKNVYTVENSFNGFVIANCKLPFDYNQWYQPSFDLLLKNADGVEIGKTAVSGDQYYPGIVDGAVVNVKIQPTVIKIDLTYNGDNYYDVHTFIFGNTNRQVWTTFSSGDLGAFYITPMENQDLSITVADNNYNNLSKTYTIPWETIKDSIGKQIDVVLEPA